MHADKIYKILLIDDDAVIQKSLSIILTELGYSVMVASDGPEGISLFSSECPDLVILDLYMPVMDGLEVLSRLIQIDPNAPVVMISGQGQMQDAINTLTMGAWDYLTKPVKDIGIFDHAIKRALERAFLLDQNRLHQAHLESEVRKRTQDLENRTKDLSVALKQVEREVVDRKRAEAKVMELNEVLEERVTLRTAQLEEAYAELKQILYQIEEDEKAGRAIQFQLLPDEFTRYNRCSFDWQIFPSRMLSGDFLGHFRLSDHEVGFYMADVSGHGVSSAFVTVMLYSFFERYVKLHMAHDDETIMNPAEMLNRLNDELLSESIDKYLTIFYGVLNTRDCRLHYSNAGQFPFPLLISNKKTAYIRMNSYPIGLFDYSTFENASLELSESCQLLLISDGILEIIDADSIAEQEQIICKTVLSSDMGLDSIVNHLGLGAHLLAPDDISLMLIRFFENKE